jgi:acyl carrier protein
MLDKHFGVKIPDSNAARETLQSVATIVAAVERQLAGPAV